MFEGLLGIVGSIFTGGMTGIVGVAVQRFFDFQNKKQDLKKMELTFSHEATMKRIDGELMVQEWEQRANVARVEGEARVEQADAEAFGKSFSSEPKLYSKGAKLGPLATGFMVALDFIRGLIRPGLTVYLCAITTVLYWQAESIINALGGLSADQALAIYLDVQNMILYLTSTCVLWWWGTRNKSKPPQ